MTERTFVVVSGLPGSGKTTLARQLAPALQLPLIDKDDILDRLFDLKGIGDAEWRRTLSRESDVLLESRAKASAGAVLVSFWRLAGMPKDSGTPTGWLAKLSKQVVNVHCVCEPEIAARRFLERKRHAGHLDRQATHAEVLAAFLALLRNEPLDVGRKIIVDTSGPTDLPQIIRDIRNALGGHDALSG